MKAISFLAALLLLFSACEFEREALYDDAESAASQQDTLFNLHAVSVGYDSVNLEWNVVPDTVTYRYFRALSDDFTSTGPIELTGTTYTDFGMVPNTKYYFMVCASYSDGGEDCSKVLSVNTNSLPVPKNLRVVSVTETSVMLEWDPVDGISTYIVHRVEDGMSFSTSGVGYQDNSVTAGNNYTYYVTCMVSPYGEGGRSNQVTASPQIPPAPGAPGNLTIVSSTATSVTLSWSAAPDLGVTGWYEVWWDDNFDWSSPLSTNVSKDITTFMIEGLSQKVDYYCKVIAYNNYGTSSSSEIISDGFERISYQDIFQDITNYPSMYMSSPISIDQFTIGDIFWYSTNTLLYGKFQILNDVSGGTFQIRYVTYNAGGTGVESFSDNISITLNNAFDLDTGNFNTTDQDFFWGGDPLLFVPNTGNEAKFKELPF